MLELLHASEKPSLKAEVEPVEAVVSGHHAEVAGWIGGGVQIVVQLLKLLLQQISSFTLRLTAGAHSENTDSGSVVGGRVDCFLF